VSTKDYPRTPVPDFVLGPSVWRTIPRSSCVTGLVGSFPDRTSLIHLVGAVLAKQNDEWIEGRRYLCPDVLARARITPLPLARTRRCHRHRPPGPQRLTNTKDHASIVKHHARGLDRAEYETAPRGVRGEVLRREGLYSSHLTEWRKARDAGALAALAATRGRPPQDPVGQDNVRLRERNARLESDLDTARRVIECREKSRLSWKICPRERTTHPRP